MPPPLHTPSPHTGARSTSLGTQPLLPTALPGPCWKPKHLRAAAQARTPSAPLSFPPDTQEEMASHLASSHAALPGSKVTGFPLCSQNGLPRLQVLAAMCLPRTSSQALNSFTSARELPSHCLLLWRTTGDAPTAPGLVSGIPGDRTESSVCLPLSHTQ